MEGAALVELKELFSLTDGKGIVFLRSNCMTIFFTNMTNFQRRMKNGICGAGLDQKEIL